eukprot:Skav227899  [mRNA]  locus=scaffold4087:171227:173433:- [translate_table: standard]
MQEPPSKRPRLTPFEPPHVLAAKAKAAKPPKEPPEFQDLLVQDFASGKSSACKAQLVASSAVRWCEGTGGIVKNTDLVKRISKLGTSGKHAKNCERDFHFLLRSFAKRFGVRISTVPARLYCHTSSSVEWRPISVIYPDDMANALFARGATAWHHAMFGHHSPDEVKAFWKHCQTTCDWFKGGPCHNYPLLEKIIPMSFYGDDIAAYRGSETGSITVLGWSSDLAFKNSSILRYWPIAIYPDYCATESTYDDIMQHVVRRVQNMLDPRTVHDWSSGGYVFQFSSLQGDLKFIRDQYHLHNYRSNSFCSSFLHDCLHSQLLGTGKTVNGSAIVYLAETGFWGVFPDGLYQDALATVLKQAHVHFLAWKKQHKLQASQPRFTPARLSRKTRMDYPVLSSKGIPSKVLTFWIAHCCEQHAARADATDLDKLVSTCLHSYASSLRLMDVAGLVLTESEAEAYYQAVMLHLLSYAALHSRSRSAKGKEPNRTMWMLICKHHHYYHHAKLTRRERINPRVTQLLAAEDWVGRIGRISRATHKSNVSLRTLERYLALVHLELCKLER